MKIVSPFKPFPPSNAAHKRLGPFDWIGALRMLERSVQRACGCPTYVITDVAADVDFPGYRFSTTQSQLMLWVLEVSLRYLESPCFDEHTVMLSPDMLVFRDLRHWFQGDLGLVVRTQDKYAEKPLLNGAQWWNVKAKPQLIAFYRRVLAVAERLEASSKRWGADTEAIVRLLPPQPRGMMDCDGLRVFGIPSGHVLQTIPKTTIERLRTGGSIPWPAIPIVDFKYTRKQYLAAYFDATLGSLVRA